MSKEKQPWEMSYAELYEAWAARHDFGSKGSMTPSEAKEVHDKWKRLGILAKKGLL